MMYWVGKYFVCKFFFELWEEFLVFFEEVGWGIFINVSVKKQEFEFEFEGLIIFNWFKYQKELCFQLEVGFIVE